MFPYAPSKFIQFNPMFHPGSPGLCPPCISYQVSLHGNTPMTHTFSMSTSTLISRCKNSIAQDRSEVAKILRHIGDILQRNLLGWLTPSQCSGQSFIFYISN